MQEWWKERNQDRKKQERDSSSQNVKKSLGYWLMAHSVDELFKNLFFNQKLESELPKARSPQPLCPLRLASKLYSHLK
jgi:hypothetical protein